MTECDPNVWSGRALQENFHRVGGCAVLHQCIRPLIGACGAPGHHGYQRACDLITGKASWAIWVTSVRMRREDRSSISFLILSQTSAGKMLRRLALNDHAAWVLLASNVRP
jgi:hypothetical protein